MSLQELNQKLKEHNLIGYWTIPNTKHGLSRAGSELPAVSLEVEQNP